MLYPLIACRHFKAVLGEDEGRGHVRPEGGSTEVEKVQMVPPQETTRASEIVVRLGAFVDHSAVGGFDSHDAAVEDATVAAAGIGGEDNALPIGRDAGLKVVQPASLELRGDGETARADLHHQLRRRLPRLASSVCLDYLSQQRAAHRVSLPGLAAKGPERRGGPITDGRGLVLVTTQRPAHYQRVTGVG